MSCKQCGANWSKDVSTRELKEEIKQRQAFAQEAKRAYMVKAWPMYGWAAWLGIFNVVVAIFAMGFLTRPLLLWSMQLSVTFAQPIVILMLTFVLLIFSLPWIFMIIKENRLVAAFKKDHPELDAVLSLA